MPSPPLIPKKNLPHIQKCFPISWSKSLHFPSSTTPSEKVRDELKPPPSPATPLVDSVVSLSTHGLLSEASAVFSLLLRLHSSSPRLFVRPLTSLLSCSTARRALPQGQQLHALVLSLGLSENPYLVFKLTSLYSAFDLLADARAVVEGAIKMQTLPWNLLLSAYVRNGCSEVPGWLEGTRRMLEPSGRARSTKWRCQNIGRYDKDARRYRGAQKGRDEYRSPWEGPGIPNGDVGWRKAQ